MCWAIPALCAQHVDVEGGPFWKFGMVTAGTPVHPCHSRVLKCIVDWYRPIPSLCHPISKPFTQHATVDGQLFWNFEQWLCHDPRALAVHPFQNVSEILQNTKLCYILVMSGRWWQQPMRSVWKQHQQSCLVTLTSLITGTPSQSYLEERCTHVSSPCIFITFLNFIVTSY